MLVVEDARECTQCSQLACSKCIEGWRNEGNSRCAHCQANLSLANQINRFVLQTLDRVIFRCDKCAVQFTYPERKQHWETCGVAFKCTLEGCSVMLQELGSLEALKNHWTHQCDAIQLQCSLCHGHLERPGIDAHNCDANLRGLVKQLRNENEELKERIRTLEARVDELTNNPMFPPGIIDPEPI